MHLVDIVNLETAAGRSIIDGLPKLPDLVHAIVGGSIDLQDVE